MTEYEELKKLADSFFDWPTEDRTQVTLTSAILFAQHVIGAAPQQAAEPVVITLGKGDKLVADIFADDSDGIIHKAGVGIFDPTPGTIYGVGVKDTRINDLPITTDRNPLVLIWSDKPESLQVIVEELQESITRLAGHPPAQPERTAPIPTVTSEMKARFNGTAAWCSTFSRCSNDNLHDQAAESRGIAGSAKHGQRVRGSSGRNRSIPRCAGADHEAALCSAGRSESDSSKGAGIAMMRGGEDGR